MGLPFFVVVCWVFVAGNNSGFNLEQHMNERDKELWFKAQGHANEAVLAALEDRSYDEIVQEKFAELIAEEYANIANGGIDPNEDYLIGDDILKHFGVEE